MEDISCAGLSLTDKVPRTLFSRLKAHKNVSEHCRKSKAAKPSSFVPHVPKAPFYACGGSMVPASFHRDQEKKKWASTRSDCITVERIVYLFTQTPACISKKKKKKRKRKDPSFFFSFFATLQGPPLPRRVCSFRENLDSWRHLRRFPFSGRAFWSRLRARSVERSLKSLTESSKTTITERPKQEEGEEKSKARKERKKNDILTKQKERGVKRTDS